MTTEPRTPNSSGYYVPTTADATHLLDGHELVTSVRPVPHIVHEIERRDREAFSGDRRSSLYPQMDRAAMREHGLYFVHNIPTGLDDFNGDLLIDGNRLAPLGT